jgi:flagellin
MAMNSVNTNTSALVALQSLNRTTGQLDVTQKRISTGFRVADAKDDGAAFAVAQKVRADMAGLTSANEQLGATKGLLDTTLSGLGRISDTLANVRSVVIKLADDQVTGSLRESYEAQYTELSKQVGRFVNDSVYNGVTLLGVSAAGGGTAADGTSFNVVRNEVGGTFEIAGLTLTGGDNKLDLASVADVTTGAADEAAEALAWQATLEAGAGSAGELRYVEAQVNSSLNAFGNANRQVDNQISFNKDKLDALESGLGALIDADLAKEAARLQALQIRQQLGATALSTANSAPQVLLSLFR